MNSYPKLLIACCFFSTLLGCSQFSVQQQLEKYAEQQRQARKIPRKITDILTLIDIQAGENELIQVFTIKGPIGKIKQKKDELELNVLAELKKNKAQIKDLIAYKVVMTFKYLHAASKEEIHVFQVKPWNDL